MATQVRPLLKVDTTVIGAGIVGAAIARELAARVPSLALVEGRSDVGDGTSKANTAILHTGFDAKPGTLESRLVREGSLRLHAYAAECGIPVKRTGAVLVAWNEEQLVALPGLAAKAARNGYTSTRILGAAEVRSMLPHLGEGVLGGLEVPDESIVCTWTTNLALASDAVNRGATLLTNATVEAIDFGDTTVVHTSRGDIATRVVVNAAGLGSDVIDAMAGYDRIHITPRRGELIVYDKQAAPLVDRIVLPVPTAMGKGVLVSPTIYGNVMLGPTAEDLGDRTATGTSRQGLATLQEKGERLIPELVEEEVTTTYAGLRAASDQPDFLIDLDEPQRYVAAAGIRSTGLTAGMGIGAHVADLLEEAGLCGAERGDLPDPPTMANIGEQAARPYCDGDRIATDPEYGEIVCFCERVTKGEVRDAMESVIPPADLQGLRRRTRVMNGRCQGFYCAAHIEDLFNGFRKEVTR
jgi:Predicted dehydrogenase